MLTSFGIYLDINESTYLFKVDNLVFYFSSQFYMNNFKNKYKEFIKNENSKLLTRYHINIDLRIYLLIILYRQIEKRGFRIYDEATKNYLTENVSLSTVITNY